MCLLKEKRQGGVLSRYPVLISIILTKVYLQRVERAIGMNIIRQMQSGGILFKTKDTFIAMPARAEGMRRDEDGACGIGQ